MSTAEMRSHSGPVDVRHFPPKNSFADRLTQAGFFVPDQAQMRQMMLATAVHLPWSAKLETIEAAQRNPPAKGWQAFRTYTLAAYASVPQSSMGAPMPAEVSAHIEAVREEFPEAGVRLHAHPFDDPFVEFELGGEKVITMAWRRFIGGDYALFPAA
jgi:hypothetical protein